LSTLTFTCGDTAPSVTGALTTPAGAPVNLAGCTVRFQMSRVGEFRHAVDATAVVTDEAGGLVRYDWAQHDLDDPGSYQSRWRIYATSGGTVEHSDPVNTITVAAV
jgi:hypothetical protein